MPRRKNEPLAPYERPSHDTVGGHRYGDGWTYRACSICGRPPEANCHQ